MRTTLHVLEHHLMVYRRTWRGGLVTTLLSPVLFLLAMGVGLGTFVNASDTAAFGGVSYLVFLAPGLLATQAMQTGANESMYPVMAGLAWERTYQAMVSTPLRSRDVVVGQLLWLTVRLTLVSAAFIAVSVVFGATDLLRGLAMLPVAVATGLAFGVPITAYTATRQRESSFAAINRFIITPLFVFSGTFFPITQLPVALQVVAWVTPLWHGVNLARGIALGDVDLALAAVDVAVLGAYIAVGLMAGLVTFRRRLFN